MGIKSFLKQLFCCSQSPQQENQVAPLSPEPDEQARHRSSHLIERVKEIEAWSKMFYHNAEMEMSESKTQDENEQKMVEAVCAKVIPELPLPPKLIRIAPIHSWSYLDNIKEETIRRNTPSI